MITNLVGELINSPIRDIGLGVNVYDTTTNRYLASFTPGTNLKSIKIERVGDNSKFFGYGICQKANIHVIDPTAAITASFSGTYHRISFKASVQSEPFYSVPDFYTTEVHRDENTGELSITAYDKLYKANTLTLADVVMPEVPYSIITVVEACANALGIEDIFWPGDCLDCIQYQYTNGANFDGTETIREVLDDCAEATQTVYFLDYNNALCFKILSSSNRGRTITEEDYYTLKNRDNRRLTTIYRTTELGDDVYISTGQAGTTQYVRDNAFWDFHEDLPTALENAKNRVGNLTINQFECYWRGDFRLEIGDKIDLITKNGSTVSSYLLNDTIEYDGSYSQTTEWSYEDNDTETADNPSSLGETLKKTYAKVDKVNKQIDLVVSSTEANSAAISAIQLNEGSIISSVEAQQQTIDELSGSISSLTEKVSATMTENDFKIEVEKIYEDIENKDKITTSTGFTFNEEGLTVEKSGKEMKTTITEDGMTVYKDGDAVLTANNVGVDAVNLRATTYLIVGTNSRFENYGDDRTGCFWIG